MVESTAQANNTYPPPIEQEESNESEIDTKSIVSRENKSSVKGKFTINVCDARSELSLLRAIIEDNQPLYSEQHLRGAKAGLTWLWPGYGDRNCETIKTVQNTLFNMLPGCNIMDSKRQEAEIDQLMSKLFPEKENYDFSPATFIVPEQKEQLKEHMKKTKKTYIAKPCNGSEGCGIILVQDFNKIPSQFMDSGDYIVQEYRDDPLLINNKKFDLRIYVLVKDWENIEAYLAGEGLVRLCTKDYEKPSQANLHNLLSHLTNFSLNKLDKDFVSAEDLADQEIASKRTLSSVLPLLEETCGIDAQKLMSEIGMICAKSLKVYQPFALIKSKVAFEGGVTAKGSTCFQVVGFDIFVDSKGKPWVLEINSTPSLNIEICKEGATGLIKNPSEVDRFIKTKILGDAIDFARTKGKNLGCYTQIAPNDELEQYNILMQIYQAFNLVKGRNDKLGLSQFGKMSKKQIGKSQTDLEMLFTKITKSQNVDRINFNLFIDALFIIADNKIDGVEHVLQALLA